MISHLIVNHRGSCKAIMKYLIGKKALYIYIKFRCVCMSYVSYVSSVYVSTCKLEWCTYVEKVCIYAMYVRHVFM